ncbi:MAG: diguanylate cyclase [Actinomycetota bacterium]
MPSKADHYADVLRFTPSACVLLEDGVVQAANPEAVDTTGIPLGRLLGVQLEEFLLPDFHLLWREVLAEAMPEPTHARLRLLRGLTPIEASLRRLPDDLVMVGLRNTELEHRYSAMAGADLTHDGLTGLSNRYHLLSRLNDRLNDRVPGSAAVIGLWIDELPSLAETRGSRVVDRVIKDVGSRLQARLRGPDVVGRFEPAGFVTVLGSDATVPQLTDIAGRLRDEVAFPVELDAGLVSFTASVAVGSLSERRPSIERVLTQLDAAARRLSNGPGNATEVLEF